MPRKVIKGLEGLFPADKEKCGDCGAPNMAGESFRLAMYPMDLTHVCADCYDARESNHRSKQVEAYVSGEREPDDTAEITCPYCGDELGDSWEMPDEDTHHCENCGKEFRYERNTVITYSSHRIEQEDDEDDD